MPERNGSTKRRSRPQAQSFRREASLRRHRLERLRARITRGVYLVRAVKIAAAMLDEGVDCDLRPA